MSGQSDQLSKLNKKAEAKKSKAQSEIERLNEKSKTGAFRFILLEKGVWYKVLELKKARYGQYNQKEYTLVLQKYGTYEAPEKYILPSS